MFSAGGRLLEREGELERLRALLGAASAGAGAAVLLTGPAGIGKTRLARAVQALAEAEDARVLVARGAELERDYAFGAVRQWLEPLVRSGAAGEVLAGAAALAGPVLRGEPVEPGDASFSVLHGLYWLVADLAREQPPLVLILDDAQWSDEASLRFAAFLARRLDGLPALLLLTSREPLAGSLAHLSADLVAETLELPPLGPDATATFLRAQVEEVDEVFALACHQATGGNPFLLTELAQALVAEGVRFVASERGRVPSIGPRSVATAIRLRLARLEPAAGRLARALAVVGDDTPVSLAAAVAELDAETVTVEADALAQAGILQDARPLRFVHPIVAAAIAESLLAGERQALHARAAEVLTARGAPAEAVAVHLAALEPRGDEHAAATLVEAARRACSRGAPEAAATLLERALAEPVAVRDRAEVLLELGRAEHELERPSAAERLREAHRCAADPRVRARAALLLTWAVVSSVDDRRDVMELLDEAIAGLDASEHDLILRLEAAWLSVAWDRGLLDDVLTRGKQFAGLEGRTPGECLVLAYLAHARMDSGLPVAEVAPLAERAARREFALELGLHSAWLIHTGTVLRTAERLETELNLLDHAVTEAQSRGSLRGYVLASMYRAAVLIRAGDVTGSEADARAALAADARDLVFLPAVAQLVEALVEQGRLDEAAVLLGSHDLAGELGDFRHGTVLLFSRALLRAEQGAHAAALADLAEARERLDRVGRLNVVGLDGRVRGALLLRALKRLEEADAEAVLAVEAATRWGTSGAIGTAEHGLALVRGDLELLEHAVEQLAGSPLRLAYAKALVDLGAMLRRTGRRSDSRAPLRAALALADECGATATRERARQELAAGGVRVRREAVRGVAALTPSERRIAERAAAGASNPEIAQALFVTVKTVEMHLSHAYRKLGIPGRRELAQALANGGS